MPRKHIDFAPKLPVLPDEPVESKPVVSFHNARRNRFGWPATIVAVLIVVAAAVYVWFV